MTRQTLGMDDTKNGFSSSLDKGGDRKTRKKVWRSGIVKFATNTTLHGVRYMASNIGVTRKCFWILLVMLCSSYMCVQIVERVLQFYSHPTTVNVKINFNKTLAFPALTICNQNAFRSSAAAESNVYGLIEELFSPNSSSALMPTRKADKMNAPRPHEINIGELYTKTSHSKEDLIVECEWQDRYCGPENFTEVITDHGVCYTFNHDSDNPLWVSSAGSEHGIKLTLNVEQYEYMPGPHDAAGVKLLVHDRKEFPSVANLGLSIPTGAHAYVGMQLVRVENLPHPHGSCSSESSPYYKSYSTDACQLACFTEFMDLECGCRDKYMPHLGGDPPVCTVEQYITCFKPSEAKVHRRVEEECYCPVPCKFLIYDSIISFSATSAYAQERLLTKTTTDSLKKKYLAAREISSRMNPIKFNKLVRLERTARSTFDELKNVMLSAGLSHVTAQRNILQSIYEDIKSIHERKLYLLRWQEFNVNKNFIRVKQAMEERTLFPVMHGFQELGYQIEIRIRQMANPPSNLTFSEDVRLALYMETMNMINGRIQLCDKAHRNYTYLYKAYLNGKRIYGYIFEKEPKRDNDYIVPKKLLKDSLFRTPNAAKYSKLLGVNLRRIQRQLRAYSAHANVSYFNNTVNETTLHATNVLFYNRGRAFYQSRSEFYKESIEYPARYMKSKIEDFERRWRSFESNYQMLSNSVNTILNNLVHLNSSILSRIKQGMDSTEKFINFKNVTKQQAAAELTSHDTNVGINDFKLFFNELRSRGQDIFDGWSTLLHFTNAIWEVILNDENMQEIYEYRNMTDFLRNFTDVRSEYRENFTRIRDLYDPRFIVGNSDIMFLINVESLIEHMRLYKIGNRLDSTFIKDNFLQLDVFYREKSYEQITQQPAYDIFALICDIGGSMGLFIGASVLSLYEIIELFLHVFLRPLFRNSKRSPGKANHPDSSNRFTNPEHFNKPLG